MYALVLIREFSRKFYFSTVVIFSPGITTYFFISYNSFYHLGFFIREIYKNCDIKTKQFYKNLNESLIHSKK